MVSSPGAIIFRELSARATDFLHELDDPAIVRPGALSSDVAQLLRAEQVHRLRANIASLRERQREFNQKIEEYIDNLERLVASLERSPPSRGDHERPKTATLVTCPSCRGEREFPELHVIFARESDESLTSPTDCYVSDRGRLVKGRFRCETCREEALTIRTYQPGVERPRACE